MSNQTLINVSKIIPKEILEADKKKSKLKKRNLKTQKIKAKKKAKTIIQTN